MTDIAGIVQSVVGIAAVGVKLSKTLYQVAHGTVSPRHSLHRIAASVSGFALTLRLLAAILQAPGGLYTPAAIESLDQLLKEAGALFQDFTTLVVHARDKAEPPREPVPANGRRRRFSIVARVKFYFEQPYIGVLIARLDYLNATLNALLKTLDVAATSARLTRSGKSVPEVNQELNHEKLHLETLIVAQQLTINAVQDAQADYEQHHAQQADESLPEIERAAEQRYPKLITQNTGAGFDPMRLCDESLDFLDPKPSVASDDDSSGDSSGNRSDHVVDSLLQRWSNAPTETLAPTLEPDDDLHPLHDLPDEAITTSGEHTPELRVGSFDATEQKRFSSAPLQSPGVPSQFLNPSAAMAPSAERRLQAPGNEGRTSPHPPEHFQASTSRPPSRNEYLARNGVPFTPAPPPFPSSGASALPTRAMTLASGSQANADRRPAMVERSSSNYRKPHVSSGSSSEASSDSEQDLRDRNPARRTSTSSKHSHHDSGIGDGLGIPWRIRISASKYFDFRDSKLVGPRTPYLPNEPRHWIYSHDNATTEISKKWVAEMAVIEKKYAFVNLREEQSSDAVCGSEGAWRIMQPLKFEEIEALVTRTIELYRRQSPTLSSTIGQSRPPATAPSIVVPAMAAATAAIPLSREKQPYARGKSYHTPAPPPLAPVQASQHRSVSFNDAVQSGGALDTRAARGLVGPNGPHTPVSPMMSNAGPGSPVIHNAYRRGGPPPAPDWRDHHRDGYGMPSPRDRPTYDREREHARDLWPERDYHRERPASRSSKHRHHHRERERERDRDRGPEKRDDDKKKGKSSMPGSTLAKVGGLWALLEGLDGI